MPDAHDTTIRHSGDPAAAVAETRPGVYFVSNYPPYDHWSPAALDAVERILSAPPANPAPLGLYLHVPFCRRRCRFCYFKVYTEQNAASVRRYADALIAAVRRQLARPFAAGRRLRFVYFGGGTPSYLSTRQLTAVFDALDGAVALAPDAEIAFEAEPGTLNAAKLELLAARGVTRLSLGVESFDDALLARNGRAHQRAHIDEAWALARAAGFPQINVDLIAGLEGHDDVSWQAEIDALLALQPDSVTIYQLEVPFNTTLYREMAAGAARGAAPLADWPTKRRWVGEAFARLEAAGYTIGSGYTAVKDPARRPFVYRDLLWRGADMLGVGVSAFSHVQGAHFQVEKSLDRWLERTEAGEVPLARGYLMDPTERAIRAFVLQLKHGRLDRVAWAARHGADPAERFATPLRPLYEAGLASLTDDAIVLSREALLRVDTLLPAFFLPHHGGPASPRAAAS